MIDALLVFPPQWSPFQPPLSLPSLAAWLRRAGFTVECADLNTRLYDWLLDDECVEMLLETIDGQPWTAAKKRGFGAILRDAPDFRATIGALKRAGQPGTDPESYLKAHYLATKGFDTYLAAVSEVSDDFSISPYHFRLTEGTLSMTVLERLVASPPPVIEAFADRMVDEILEETEARAIGLSCIGQEQLYFTVLLGAKLKQRSSAPIMVGGTIFSRIFERGTLNPTWFGRFFDLIVRNEGERPAEKILANLREDRPAWEDVSGLVYLAPGQDGQIEWTEPSCPLQPEELPIPDFDGMPLESYVSAEVTLPLLSSRGCYWGKCEFCHHGMVYGEQYASYGVDRVVETVATLSEKYGATHFAFNDEALPPKVARALGESLPPRSESGWSFTALIKFERYYTRSDFENLARAGVRSLYIGLESASERVLGLMKKPNKLETIVRNLRDATEAGIWVHNFLFFGFPGETEEDARKTYDFVLESSEIMGSFGCGTFSLEHNAPIFGHLEDFGLSLRIIDGDSVDVYYRYDAQAGISAERASEWARKLTRDSLKIPKFRAVGWIPREHLLCMLAAVSAEELIRFGSNLDATGGLPAAARLDEIVNLHPASRPLESVLLVNQVTRRVLDLTGSAAQLMELLYDRGWTIGEVASGAPPVLEWLSALTGDTAAELEVATA